MKKLLSIFVFALLTSFWCTAQEVYYELYKSQDWEKLTKKLEPVLQKQPKNVVANHVAGMMYANQNYPGYSYDKAYNYLQTTKTELGKMSSADRQKYSKYLTVKKVQKDFDTVCQRLFEATYALHSVSQCNQFLKNYKRAPKELLDSITTLRNMWAFEDAQKVNTKDAYQTFITTYPDAKEISTAIKRRDSIAFNETVRKNSCDAYLDFIKTYPQSDYIPQVQKLYLEKISSANTEGKTFADYEKYVIANPKDKNSTFAIRKMIEIAKSQKDINLFQKAVEYSRDIDFEYALYEFYKEFTSDGETYTLYTFVDMYPRTFLDTLVAKDFKIAGKGDALALTEPYDSAKSYRLFTEYIKMAAPKEKAFVVLQKLISLDVAEHNWKKAAKTVSTYKPYFGKQSGRVDNLLRLLNAQEDKSVVRKEFSFVINTKEGGEYSPIITADGKYLFFCGKNRPDNIGKTEDIFLSEWGVDDWTKPMLLTKMSSPMTNEAVISVSTDGTEMLYFKEGVINRAEKGLYGWEPGTNVSDQINNARWSADAMITSDGKAIIFSSVRDEGYNYYTKQNASLGVYHGAIHHQSDIYVSLKTDKGWGKPINLGPTINTIYTDRSPYLHHDMKTLYFSSDGHGGMGNLDVFVSTRLSDTCWDCWSEPINLGKEINSSEEDWGYRIAPNGKDFYYAARETGTKQNDLFYVTIPEKYRPEAVVKIVGKITDSKGKPVETQIVWEDLASGDVIETSKSNPADGQYFTILPNGKMYGYYVEDSKYYPQSQNVDLTKGTASQTVTNNIVVTSYAEMKEQKIPVRLNNLFFDTDKSDLLPYSIPELKRVAKIIKENNLRVEIAGHTDNVGEDNYNMSLSLRRAEAVKSFLVKQGCPSNLFEVVGHGEAKPQTTNDTAEGRALNRRVEMRFL